MNESVKILIIDNFGGSCQTCDKPCPLKNNNKNNNIYFLDSHECTTNKGIVKYKGSSIVIANDENKFLQKGEYSDNNKSLKFNYIILHPGMKNSKTDYMSVLNSIDKDPFKDPKIIFISKGSDSWETPVLVHNAILNDKDNDNDETPKAKEENLTNDILSGLFYLQMIELSVEDDEKYIKINENNKLVEIDGKEVKEGSGIKWVKNKIEFVENCKTNGNNNTVCFTKKEIDNIIKAIKAIKAIEILNQKKNSNELLFFCNIIKLYKQIHENEAKESYKNEILKKIDLNSVVTAISGLIKDKKILEQLKTECQKFNDVISAFEDLKNKNILDKLREALEDLKNELKNIKGAKNGN